MVNEPIQAMEQLSDGQCGELALRTRFLRESFQARAQTRDTRSAVLKVLVHRWQSGRNSKPLMALMRY